MSPRKPRKPRMGRPSLPRDEVRRVFAVRLNATERKAIKKAAERDGVPASQWAREVLLKIAVLEPDW